MVKSWWIESAGRQTSSAIETWTERHISPLAISDECDKVTEWLDSGSQQDDDGMKIRVSKGAREITAGYDVDDQMMQIVIKLPGAYPLRQATVEGVSRVGVDEKKWRSWLLNTQGVIKFSVSPAAPLLFFPPHLHTHVIFPRERLGPGCVIPVSIPVSVQATGIYLHWRHVLPTLSFSLPDDRLAQPGTERLNHRRTLSVAQERERRNQGPDRVRHLLRPGVGGQSAAVEEVRYMQEFVPRR